MIVIAKKKETSHFSEHVLYVTFLGQPRISLRVSDSFKDVSPSLHSLFTTFYHFQLKAAGIDGH